MKKILALVDIIKDETGSVLIQGENGTGKEVIAWLHRKDTFRCSLLLKTLE